MGHEAPEPKPSREEVTANDLDLESLRLGQDFVQATPTKRLLTNVPVRKPVKQSFVRVRPGSEWRLDSYVLEDQQTRTLYVVKRDIWPDVGEHARPVTLVTAIDRSGTLFLWPLKLPGPDGRTNPWNDSAIAAAKAAETAWVRVTSNMEVGTYEVFQALADLGQPDWPEISFSEIVSLAFQHATISSPDHPILRRLRGEIA